MSPVKKWDQARVVETIKERHAKGLPINSNHQQIHERALYNAAVTYWKGWKQAIEAAGFNYEDIKLPNHYPESRRKWNKEKVIEAIKKRSVDGEPLNSNYMQQHEQPLYGAGNMYFGSWQKAIEAAGLDYASLRKVEHRSWSHEAIVEEIKRRKKLKLSLNTEKVCAEDRGLYQAAKRWFGRGGWRTALLRAGVNPKDIDPKRTWTRRRILTRIKRLHQVGAPLYGYALIKAGEGNLVAGGEKYFGSWRKTIEAAGFNWSEIRGSKKFRWWTPNRVLSKIRALEAQGMRLSMKEMRKKHNDLIGAAILHFDSWSQAVYAAGIDYQKHCMVWSYKAWLRKLNNEEITQLEDDIIDYAQKGGRNDRTINE